MNFKTVVTKEDGGKTANTFSLLRDAKKYARKYSSPGDHVKITESGNKEVFIPPTDSSVIVPSLPR